MQEKQQEIRKIQELIRNGQHFLVMGHRSVDGDAYGSSMALYFYLQKIGKNVEVINELPITPLFHFLNTHTQVSDRVTGAKFDAIFVCDCGELHLVWKFPDKYADIFKNTPIVNIDHHNRNSLFGAYNLVDTEASSTCELVYSLIEWTPMDISPQIATLLLFGIIRDTNCFKNSIRPETFEITGKLMPLGADYSKVIFHSYKSEKLNYLQLYGHILENLISLRWGAIVGGVVTEEIFDRFGIPESELGPQLINEVLSSIEGADFAFLIKETGTAEKKLSFRARRDGFDVSRIARHFGGGGHIQSAGAYTSESLEEILRIIEEMDARM